MATLLFLCRIFGKTRSAKYRKETLEEALGLFQMSTNGFLPQNVARKSRPFYQSIGLLNFRASLYWDDLYEIKRLDNVLPLMFDRNNCNKLKVLL